MAEETQIKVKSKLTVGSVLLWLSFLLLFAPCVVPIEYSGQIRALFWAIGAMLLLGFGISCWQDHRSNTSFSTGRLIFVVVMILMYVIFSKVIFSAAVA